MKIEKNSIIKYLLIISTILFLYILLLPYFSNVTQIKVKTDKDNDVLIVKPKEERYIVFYEGFDNDLILVYRNDFFDDFFHINNTMYDKHNLKYKSIEYNNKNDQDVDIYINFSPFNKINIAIKENYNFVLISKKENKIELTYTNSLIWFEM